MATDPRAANCREYAEEGGLVTGVELEVRSNPLAKYALMAVKLIDEKTQGPGGPTIAWFTVFDKDGRQTFDGNVMLTWPWPRATGKLPPGTPGQHMITNGFEPPDVGPLEIRIEDAAGNVISDRVGGLGLPFSHHVSFQMFFQERTVVPVPDPDPQPGESGETVALLRELLAAVKAGFRL